MLMEILEYALQVYNALNGRQEGADLLFSAIVRLKSGETAEEIIAAGIPETIIEKALLIK